MEIYTEKTETEAVLKIFFTVRFPKMTNEFSKLHLRSSHNNMGFWSAELKQFLDLSMF